MSNLYRLEFFVGNTNLISLTLTDQAGTAITTATVTVTLTDLDDVEVSGDTWPKSMTHAGSGVYQASLAYAIDVEDGDKLLAKITADATDGSRAYWEEPVTVLTRTNETQQRDPY